MSSINNIQVESRSERLERRGREQEREKSRASYYNFIKRINDSAVSYVFARRDLEEANRARQDFQSRNRDEAEATVYRKIGFILLLLALVAVVVIDYLIVGGTFDYLLGMQRELQGYENYFVFLKLLATTVLLLIEVSVAIGLAWLRESLKSKWSVVLHWIAGLGVAFALTFFAGSLMYQKIVNESVQASVVSNPTIADESSQVEEDDLVVPEIPTQKWLMLAGVCGLCFLVHIFAVMKADTVADAVAWTGFAVRDARYAGRIRLHQAAADRAAGETEASYRNAYDQFESHNARFPDDLLPSATSQQDQNQRIPVMRLNPVAQRIIENLQNGTVENLDAAQEAGQNNGQTEPLFDAGADIDDGDAGDNPPPANQPPGDAGDNNGFYGNQNNGNAAYGNAGNNFNVDGNGNHAAGNGANRDNAEADFYRTIIDAQVRNSEGEI